MNKVEVIVPFAGFLKVIVENPDSQDDTTRLAVTAPVSVTVGTEDADVVPGEFTMFSKLIQNKISALQYTEALIVKVEMQDFQRFRYMQQL